MILETDERSSSFYDRDISDLQIDAVINSGRSQHSEVGRHLMNMSNSEVEESYYA